MSEKLDKHILKNGMVILGEPIEQVGSAAFTFLLPSGSSRFPYGCCGAGAVITDWIFRGAGDRNSRQLIDALDSLGLHRNTSMNSSHISLGAALEASNLENAIDVYADIILKPTLDIDQFSLSKQLALHELAGLEDDPRQKVMLNLCEQFYPTPLGLPAIGKLDELERLEPDGTSSIIKENFNLSQTIFAVAGKYNFSAICKRIEKLFNTPQPECDTKITIGEKGEYRTHFPHDGAQVHIGLMTDTVAVTTENYYNARTAVSVLSGGMSSRLFTEVREKRGLCYAVGAQYNSLKDMAGVSCYAGTTPDKAQQTLDVIVTEFARLAEGVTENELQRAKVGLKSTLIMQSESTISRAGGIAHDYYLFSRVRPLEEIKKKFEEITVSSIGDFLAGNRFGDYTLITIGPKSIDLQKQEC